MIRHLLSSADLNRDDALLLLDTAEGLGWQRPAGCVLSVTITRF